MKNSCHNECIFMVVMVIRLIRWTCIIDSLSLFTVEVKHYIDRINLPRFDCCAHNKEDKRPVLRRTNRKSPKREWNGECNTFARMVGYKKSKVGLEFRH